MARGHKVLISVFLILFIILAGVEMARNVNKGEIVGNKNGNVSFTTDKTKYLQRELVNYELKNTGTKPITIRQGGFDMVEVWQKNGDKFERIQTFSPYSVSNMGAPWIKDVVYNSGESFKGFWSGESYGKYPVNDINVKDEDATYSTGIFKFKIGTYESNEFEIAKRPWYKPKFSLK